MAKSLALQVNGKRSSIEVDDPGMPLLYALRNDLEMHGPRFGCGLGQCGACTVLMDGKAVRSCQMPVANAEGQDIVTLEGLGSPGNLHPVQQAFIDEQAVQCGYCINGMILQSKAFLDENPDPSEEQIKDALSENLCRCGTHTRIVRAVQRAAKAMRRG